MSKDLNEILEISKPAEVTGESKGTAQNQSESGSAQVQKPSGGAWFKESDYGPFMVGIFVVAGLIGLPLTYGLAVGLGYFASLPWSLGSCVVFLIAFRKNGTLSLGRFIPAILALFLAVYAYNLSTGKPVFGAGGIVGFLLIIVCGYIGIGIGRLFGIRKE